MNISLNRELLYDKNYRYRIQKEGFLLGLDTKDDLQQFISDDNLFLVYENDHQLRGYLMIDYKKDFLDDEYKMWFDGNGKHLYYDLSLGASLNTVAVDRSSREKGIAFQLLSEAEQQLKKTGVKNLFSIITSAPITNCASLLFHTKMGFNRLAVSKPRKMFELDNYCSTLLYKAI